VKDTLLGMLCNQRVMKKWTDFASGERLSELATGCLLVAGLLASLPFNRELNGSLGQTD